MEFLKRSSAGPAQPTRPIVEASNPTEGPFIVLPFGQVSPHRISAAKGQDEVNEAKPCSVVSESLYYCARRRSSSALLATTRLPVGAVDDERCRRHWVPLGSSPQSPSPRNQPHYPATKHNRSATTAKRRGLSCAGCGSCLSWSNTWPVAAAIALGREEHLIIAALDHLGEVRIELDHRAPALEFCRAEILEPMLRLSMQWSTRCVPSGNGTTALLKLAVNVPMIPTLPSNRAA